MITIRLPELCLQHTVTKAFVVRDLKLSIGDGESLDLTFAQWRRAMSLFRHYLRETVRTVSLYNGPSRFIHPHFVSGKILLENLQTGEFVEYANDGSFRDGNGHQVVF